MNKIEKLIEKMIHQLKKDVGNKVPKSGKMSEYKVSFKNPHPNEIGDEFVLITINNFPEEIKFLEQDKNYERLRWMEASLTHRKGPEVTLLESGTKEDIIKKINSEDFKNILPAGYKCKE